MFSAEAHPEPLLFSTRLIQPMTSYASLVTLWVSSLRQQNAQFCHRVMIVTVIEVTHLYMHLKKLPLNYVLNALFPSLNTPI